FGLLGEHFQGTLLLHRYLDPQNVPALTLPEWMARGLANDGLSDLANDFLRGACVWTGLTLDTLPGLVLSFCRVMVLVSIAVALATRVPMVVNLTLVIIVFLASHLTPTLVNISRKAQDANPG